MASVLTVVPEYSDENVVNNVTINSLSSPSERNDVGRLVGVCGVNGIGRGTCQQSQSSSLSSLAAPRLCSIAQLLSPVADYPLGRVGSCLMPSMVRRPGSSAKVGFFRHYFIACEKKSEKNVLLKHFVHPFINSKRSNFTV